MSIEFKFSTWNKRYTSLFFSIFMMTSTKRIEEEYQNKSDIPLLIFNI